MHFFFSCSECNAASLYYYYDVFLLQTVESFLEETLVAIPDSVLDSTLTRPPSASEEDGLFNVEHLLPPPYDRSVAVCVNDF